ncbi:response regulator transcription factor [Halomonas vilamensis]|uniref:Response regulator transcription factor n=1 Tax=Vreelandella vilamensis TaxID=531309 RepID=A0ABU1H231_9GAMM|nr:response regulator transcription factor [Halomonas vilamensis]MDR5897583.1 response regulator transcription factor [Halomonas vilamensis]
MYTLMVADDHPLFRDAISAVITTGLPGSHLLEAASLAQAVALAEDNQALDLLLLDLGLPDAEGLSGLETLRQRLPGLAVVIVSAQQERGLVLDAITMGAVGYIPKSTPRQELLAAIGQILEGQVYLPPDIMRQPAKTPCESAVPSPDTLLRQRLAYLTAKQLDVLSCMTTGISNKLIARELNIAETTVKTHVSAILRKLDAASRVQAIVMAAEADLNGYMRQRHQDEGRRQTSGVE